MKKLRRLTEKGLFFLAVEKAVADFDRSQGDALWTEALLDEIAKSSAIGQDLSYDGFEVDSAIVKAIRTLSNTNLSVNEGMQALEDAWEAYSKHS